MDQWINGINIDFQIPGFSDLKESGIKNQEPRVNSLC